MDRRIKKFDSAIKNISNKTIKKHEKLTEVKRCSLSRYRIDNGNLTPERKRELEAEGII